MDPDLNIFSEIEDFLNFTETPSTPTTATQDESSPAPANPSTPGQTITVNQCSPGGLGGGCVPIRRGSGPQATSMLNNGYTQNMTAKAVLGERLRNQLGGRGEHPASGELKRKLDEGNGMSGTNDPILNKTLKMEIKDEPHGNQMMKTEIKEENTNSQLEAILGLNPPVSDIKSEYQIKPDYPPPPPNKVPPPTQGGLLQRALMENKPLVRGDTGGSNSMMPMFNGCGGGGPPVGLGGAIPGRPQTIPNNNVGAGGGLRNSVDGGGGTGVSAMDPQALMAIRRLRDITKDPTLNQDAKHAEASKLIKENPKVVRFLMKMRNEKDNQDRRSLANLGNPNNADIYGSLQSAVGHQQRGGGSMAGGGGNCEQQTNNNGGGIMMAGGNNDSSMNGGGPGVLAPGGGQDFSPGGTQLPGSPMNSFNEALGSNGSGGMTNHDAIQKQRMMNQQQQQWEMQHAGGGINQRIGGPPPPPNVMCGPQGAAGHGGVPTTQFVHGAGMGGPRAMGPTNTGSAYGTPVGVNNPNMNYHPAPNMIVGHNGGPNWSLMRGSPGQPGGMNKPPSGPPPNYPYRTPGNIRMDRGNIRLGSPTVAGGYPNPSGGQSNDFRQASHQAFMGCPPIRGNFAGNPNISDQYAVRNANCFPNSMYGGNVGAPTPNMENSMAMSVRLGVGFAGGPHADSMNYPNGGGGQGGQIGSGGEYVNMNSMQLGRNGGGQNGGGIIVSQGMGSPMGGHPGEFPSSVQQRGIMPNNNVNMVRSTGLHGSPGAGNRTTIPHTSPMIQQHLVSQTNVNGMPPMPGNCSAQRMMNVNAPSGGGGGGMFTANAGPPPPNMTVPESDMHRFGGGPSHPPPPNYFNEHSNDNSSGVGVGGGGGNFSSNPLQQPCLTQANQSHQRQLQQHQQTIGGQNTFLSAGGNTMVDATSNGCYSVYNSKGGNVQSMGGMDNGHQQNQQHFNTTTTDAQQQQQQQQTGNNHGWKQNAGELRKTLLTRLHQTLLDQGNANAQGVAVSVELEAFTQSTTQEAYTMKLAEWLANVFRQSSNALVVENHDPPPESKTADQPPQTMVNNFQETEMNGMKPEMAMNSQRQQQKIMPVANQQPGGVSPSGTLSTSTASVASAADSTTFQEAMAKVTTSNLPPNSSSDAVVTTDDNIKTSATQNPNNANENTSKDATVGDCVGNSNKPPSLLSKTNPMLADLLPPCSKGGAFETTNSPTANTKNVSENDAIKSTETTCNKSASTTINNTGCGKESNSSVSTPTAAGGPPSNSSIYNMPSLSPKSSISSSSSASSSSSSSSPSSSSPTIVTTSSPLSSASSSELKTMSASMSSRPTASPPPTKTCHSTGRTFAVSSVVKSNCGGGSSTSPFNAGTSSSVTTSTTIPFQSPVKFTTPMIEPTENNGSKAPQSQQTANQPTPIVSSATTVTSNNTCTATTVNKVAATIPAVRRPSGKGIGPTTQSGGHIANTATNVTILSSATAGGGVQLSNTNGPPGTGVAPVAAAGQNNVQPHSVDSGIGSPRSIASSTLYSPKIQGTSPSLVNPVSETLTISASPPDKGPSS